MPFKLEPLPYPYDALEPAISEEILHYHHDKHLKTYVDNLNKTLENYPEYQEYTLEELIKYNKTMPTQIQTPVWNNAGGVYNHNLYFSIMGPGGAAKPEGRLAEAIDDHFGSFEAFKESFAKRAAGVFGSGYTWLVSNDMGKLSLIDSKNQDTVLMYPVVPLLLIDVWEHAYYLEYKNVRADYIQQWFSVVCWEKIQEKYNQLF